MKRTLLFIILTSILLIIPFALALAQTRADIDAEFSPPLTSPTPEEDLAYDRLFIPGSPGGSTISSLVGTIGRILTSAIVPLMFVIGTVMLIWGIISYFVINADNEEKRKSARQVIIWGIVGLFLASAIGGFVLLLRNTFRSDINSTRPIDNSFPRFEVRQ